MVTVFALDHNDRVGDINAEGPESVQAEITAVTKRGLRHNWLLSNHRDVLSAEEIPAAGVDQYEVQDPSGAAFQFLSKDPANKSTLSVKVDVTWLGTYETGARVITTAAIAALANQPSIDSIALSGLTDLPSYVAPLTDNPKVPLQAVTITEATPKRADIMWYLNQIDLRSNIF